MIKKHRIRTFLIAFLLFPCFLFSQKSIKTEVINLYNGSNDFPQKLIGKTGLFLNKNFKKTDKIKFESKKGNNSIFISQDYPYSKAFLIADQTLFKINIKQKSFYEKLTDNFENIKKNLDDSNFVRENFYGLYFYIKDKKSGKYLYGKDIIPKLKISSLPGWRFLNDKPDLHDGIDFTINAGTGSNIDNKIKENYSIFVNITNHLLENNNCYIAKNYGRKKRIVGYGNFLFCDSKKDNFSFVIGHLSNFKNQFDQKLYKLKKNKSVFFIKKSTLNTSKYRELTSKISATYWKWYMKYGEFYNSKFIIDRNLIDKKMNFEIYKIVSVDEKGLELEYGDSGFAFGEHIHFGVLLNNNSYANILYDKNTYIKILNKVFWQNLSGTLIEIDPEDKLLEMKKCDLFSDNSVCKYIGNGYDLKNKLFLPENLTLIYGPNIHTEKDIYLKKQAFENLSKLSDMFMKTFGKKIFIKNGYDSSENILGLSVDISLSKLKNIKYSKKWLKDNIWKLGFIVQKQGVDNLKIRYVGINLSYFLNSKGMNFFDFLLKNLN